MANTETMTLKLDVQLTVYFKDEMPLWMFNRLRRRFNKSGRPRIKRSQRFLVHAS